MKKLLLVLSVWFGVVTATTTPCHAQIGQLSTKGSSIYESAARPLRSATPRQYNFSKAVLSDIMRLMAEDAGIGFFGLPETSDSSDERIVTFTIKSSPFTALETLAKANGISLIYDSGIWYLRPANDTELIGRIYQINYNAQEVVTKNSQGGISGGGGGSGGAGGGSGAAAGLNLQGSPDFFVTEPSRLLEDIRAIVDLPTTGSSATIAPTASLANAGQFALNSFPTQPSLVPTAPSAPSPAQGVGAGSPGSNSSASKVIWNSDSNSLYVVATRQQHNWIEAYLAAADKPQPMIAIEVKFIETSRDPSSEVGIDWNGVLGDSGINANLSGLTSPINLNNIGNYSLPTAVLSYNDLNLTLRSLYQDRNTRSVSYPRMVTLDNREVSFRSVVNQPVLGSSASTSLGAGATQTSAVEYIPIGTVINILPKMMHDCKVLLNVSVTVSDIIGTEFINGNPFPIATSRVYTAPLTVQSGYTVAISGLDAARSENSERGVPILGKLPILGEAFKTRRKDRSRQHLMMLITPVVLNSHTTGVTKQPMSQDPIVAYPTFAGGKAQVCDAGSCPPSAAPPRSSSQPRIAERPRTTSRSQVPPRVAESNAQVKKSSQTFGSRTTAPKPAEAQVSKKSVGASSVASAVASDPAPLKKAPVPATSAAPTADPQLTKIKGNLTDMQKQLKSIPEGDSKLSPDDGQLVKNIYDQSRKLLSEIDAIRGDKSTPLQGEIGEVWWNLIQVKTNAFKLSKRSPESLVINVENE